MPRNLFKVMAGISASKPNPLITSTVKGGLTDPGNCNYWIGDPTYWTYDNANGRWECTGKQFVNGGLQDNGNCPSNGNGWAIGYRPATCTATIQYKGGLSSCNIRFTIYGETTLVTNQYLILNQDVAFNSDEEKTIVFPLAWSGSEPESDSEIKEFYPSIVENDPSPLFYITRIDFSY